MARCPVHAAAGSAAEDGAAKALLDRAVKALSINQAAAALEDPEDDYAAWRQQLYPVVNSARRLVGVVKRGDLLAANTHDEAATLHAILTPDPIVTHGDQTLRHAAELMAIREVTTIPILDRGDPTLAIGIVSLPQLLTGRQRDQREARDRERVLRIRLVR